MLSGFDASITGRFTFYEDSSFDIGDPPHLCNSSAIPHKIAYLPGGGTITSASMTSYSRGINGIFVDIEGTHAALALDDFSFKVSNAAGANNTPSTWADAPAPTGFAVLSDTPAAGTDRVEFIWDDNAIENQYLEVRTLGPNDGNSRTGIPATDVFYFGHIKGDTFNDVAPTVFLTTAGDETAIQASPIVSLATIDSLFDMDRNGIHLASDLVIARSNTIFALDKINISNPPAAPAPPGALPPEAVEPRGVALDAQEMLADSDHFCGHTIEVDVDLAFIDAGGTTLPDAEEIDPGGFLAFNDDDDDGDGTPDFMDDLVAGGDNDLAEFRLVTGAVGGGQVPPGTLKLNFPATKVRIWKDQQKSDEVISGSTQFPVDADETLFVEGIDPSTSQADAQITANYTPSGQEASQASDTVAVTVVDVELDVDSNNDGTIDGADDAVEETAPGRIISLNRDDDDGNGIQDLLDNGPLAAPDNELRMIELDFEPTGLQQQTLDDLRIKLTITQGVTNVRLWDSNTKNNQINAPSTWTVAELPSMLYLEGIASGDAVLTLTAELQSTSQVVDTDTVRIMVNFVDMVPFRPQTPHFQSHAIPFAEEEVPGVYIRRNGDDDNGNGTPDRNDASVANENDLIFVRLDTGLAAPVGTRYELEKSSADIRVWTSWTKGTELLATQNSSTITFSGTQSSIWVEWATAGTGPAQATLDLRLHDNVSGNTVFTDRLVFHPFTSIVIVLGGLNQVPADPVLDPGNHGTFETAIDLYREGYDVHMYDEEVVQNNGQGPPFEEVVSAVDERGVTSVAIFGYSYGGGATYLLANGLNANPPNGAFSLDFTAYIDSIRNGGILPETQLPPNTKNHLSLYQNSNFGDQFLEGGPVPGAENVNVEDDWGLSVTHYSIDDNATVRGHLKSRLRTHVTK